MIEIQTKINVDRLNFQFKKLFLYPIFFFWFTVRDNIISHTNSENEDDLRKR